MASYFVVFAELRVCFIPASSVARGYKSKGFGTLPKFTDINAGSSVLSLSEKCAKTHLHACVI
jgi:hypothetical protein